LFLPKDLPIIPEDQPKNLNRIERVDPAIKMVSGDASHARRSDHSMKMQQDFPQALSSNTVELFNPAGGWLPFLEGKSIPPNLFVSIRL